MNGQKSIDHNNAVLKLKNSEGITQQPKLPSLTGSATPKREKFGTEKRGG